MTTKKTRKDKLPNLDNATPAFLVDELGRVRDEKKKLEQLEGFYKEALKARLEDDQTYVEGEKYEADIGEQTQNRFDKDKVIAEYGQEFYDDNCKEVTFTVIRTKRLP